MLPAANATVRGATAAAVNLGRICTDTPASPVGNLAVSWRGIVVNRTVPAFRNGQTIVPGETDATLWILLPVFAIVVRNTGRIGLTTATDVRPEEVTLVCMSGWRVVVVCRTNGCSCLVISDGCSPVGNGRSTILCTPFWPSAEFLATSGRRDPVEVWNWGCCTVSSCVRTDTDAGSCDVTCCDCAGRLLDVSRSISPDSLIAADNKLESITCNQSINHSYKFLINSHKKCHTHCLPSMLQC